MAEEHWSDDYLCMIDDCVTRESRLTEWEQGFIASLHSQIERDRRPSAKQIETLNSIWDRATEKG